MKIEITVEQAKDILDDLSQVGDLWTGTWELQQELLRITGTEW